MNGELNANKMKIEAYELVDFKWMRHGHKNLSHII